MVASKKCLFSRIDVNVCLHFKLIKVFLFSYSLLLFVCFGQSFFSLNFPSLSPINTLTRLPFLSMKYDKAILIENFDYYSSLYVCDSQKRSLFIQLLTLSGSGSGSVRNDDDEVKNRLYDGIGLFVDEKDVAL